MPFNAETGPLWAAHRSERKAAASRRNGAHGGRPKKKRWPLVKGRQDWETPPALFTALDHEFHFTLDVAASEANAKVARYFTAEQDGLAQTWAPEVCWCNPPYDPRVLALWVERAWVESRAGALVVMLLPVRTATRWWHRFAMKASEVRFLPGRVRFVLPDGSSSSAPFPSVILVFKPRGVLRDRGL